MKLQKYVSLFQGHEAWGQTCKAETEVNSYQTAGS